MKKFIAKGLVYPNLLKFSLKMKLTTLLLIVSLFKIQANSYSQNTKITLDLNDVKVEQVFREIESKTEFRFLYKNKEIALDRKVSISVKKKRIIEILDQLFEGTSTNFKIYNNRQIVLSEQSEINEVIKEPLKDEGAIQEMEISGKVTDKQGALLPGVNIIVVGTTRGTETDFDGNYTIKASKGDVLEYSFLGMLSQKVTVGDNNEINIAMQEDAAKLDEVVLVGYGKLKAKDVTGSVKLLDSDDFNRGVVNSPGQLLQGKTAGVNVTSGTGEPGGAIDINIRGVNSISGSSNPLYVIDGIPVDGGGSSANSGIGYSGTRSKSPLNFLNPQDIKSITILKDASATAIYGTRGANGVILIETKEGKKGKSTLTYDTYFSTSTVSKKLDVLSAAEYKAETARLAVLLGRDPLVHLDPADANTDWQDEIFTTALTKNHNLSFSGGSDKATFRASFGYLDQEGIIKTTGHNKITGHLIASTSVLDDKIKLKFNITAAQTEDESEATGGSDGAYGNLLTSVLRANPTAAPYDAEGKLNGKAGLPDNPLSILDAYRDLSESKTVLANMTASVALTDALSYKLNLASEMNDIDRTTRSFSTADLGGDIVDGEVGASSVENTNVLIENYLSYSKSFNDDFNIDAILGHSYQTFENKGQVIARKYLSTEEIDPVYNIGTATSTEQIRSFISERKLQSFFGRVHTGYLGKYLFTASLRADGSSVFGENNKYGYFPSAALGWKISEEDFMADSQVFDNLKLRLGWGKTGNQAVPVKVTQGSYTSNSSYGYAFNGSSQVNGITVARTPNPNLKWEVTTQSNIGLDWSIFNGRVDGTFDYFHKFTTDLFLNVSAPAPSIVSNVFINSDAEIINKGFEFALNANIIENESFRFDVGGNISFIENTIENLASDIYVGSLSAPGASGETTSIYRSGYSSGSFFLYKFNGFDADGHEKLSDEKEIVGDGLPSAIYGFNMSVGYKRFDFSLNFNGVSGVDIFNNTARAFSSAAALGQNGENGIGAHLNQQENPDQAVITSSRFLEKGDYLRLNNATLSYNMNVEKIDWLKNLRFNITGQNLFIITNYTGYDPAVNTQGGNVYGVDYAAYPKSRTILLGLNISLN